MLTDYYTSLEDNFSTISSIMDNKQSMILSNLIPLEEQVDNLFGIIFRNSNISLRK